MFWYYINLCECYIVLNVLKTYVLTRELFSFLVLYCFPNHYTFLCYRLIHMKMRLTKLQAALLYVLEVLADILVNATFMTSSFCTI
jgi:hypothetical protein